jgi:amino acid adenylation domain-containing protein
MDDPGGTDDQSGAPHIRLSDAFVEFPRDHVEQSIPARFEQQVAGHSGRLAVKTGTEALTYAELNARANRIAHAMLTGRGQQTEPVALLLEHDAPLVAAILAVLKAGRFYVPLEPSYPRARTVAVLDDAQADLIVTSNRLLPLARELAGAGRSVLNVDDLGPHSPAQDPKLSIAPDALAYVIYTSGSTGQPKGVMDSHRNVLHNVMRYTNAYRICSEDRLTLLQSCSNSGSVSSLFGALLNGAGVFPFDLGTGLDRLSRWLAAERITIYHSVPTIFRHMLAADDRLPSVRLIRLEGDRALKSDVDLYRAHFSEDCLLAVGLGITECGLVRRHIVDRETPIGDGLVPVGHAVEGMEVRLLDERGREVGLGRVGEIAVRSRYLAVGYWRRPELTHAAFGPHPDGGPKRIYRTGDLGRLRPDGVLEYLGRRDSQVKIRGHRVELVEIEHALLELTGVREAIVTAREDGSGEQRLVAYVVPTGAPGPGISTLREGLRSTLPDYMVPSAFKLLGALPLTPNGKVDRRALPEVGRERPSIETGFVAPRSPLEALVARIWSDALELEEVGVHDDFLALGGDSLLATRIVSRLRDVLRVEVSLAALLQTPTVAAQAGILLQRLLDRTDAEALTRMLDRMDRPPERGLRQRP